MYALPSARRRTPASIRIGRSSSNLRPSKRRPESSINFTCFSMCSISSMRVTSSGGPRPRLSSLHPLDQLADRFREPVRLRAFLDQPDRHRGDRRVAVLSIQPYPTVLADVNLAACHVLDHRDHAPLLPDHAGHFRRRDLHQHAALEAARLAVRHRELDPLDLVDAEDMAQDRITHLHVPCSVAELDAPRALRGVERRGIRGIDVHEPVRWTEIYDLADDRVARLRDVPPGEGDDAYQPVALGSNPELRRENLSVVAERPGSRFQPGAADGFAWNDNRAKRPATLHWFCSHTRRVQTT